MHVGLLVKRVEQTIAEVLPDCFAVMNDGCCHAEMHYVAIILTYPASTGWKFERGCLGFSSSENGER